MEEKTTLGKFIIRKRKELNMTQKELAEKLYVTESAVSKWERGISYPDITLISDLCETLQISEHELITATEDLKQRTVEKQARTYRNISKAMQWTFNLSYGIALLTCFICNIAVNHKLSWFFIVLTSIAVAFSITSMPPLIKNHRGAVTLTAFLGSVCLLLMTCAIYSGSVDWLLVAIVPILFSAVLIFLPIILNRVLMPKPWCNHKTIICFAVDTILLLVMIAVSMSYANAMGDFLSIAVPCTLFGLILPWTFMITIRYIKVNSFFKTSICLVISSIYTFIINNVINSIISKNKFTLQPVDFSNWSEKYINGNVTTIVSVSLAFLAIVFVIGGIIKDIKKKEK